MTPSQPLPAGKEVEMLTYTRYYFGARWSYWTGLVFAVLFAIAWVS